MADKLEGTSIKLDAMLILPTALVADKADKLITSAGAKAPTADVADNPGNPIESSVPKRPKLDCRLKFDKIILEGEYTAAQLIGALNYELLQKKESSIDTNSNRMTFMQNSVTYLNQRAFEAYIELINDGAKIDVAPQRPQGGTDI